MRSNYMVSRTGLGVLAILVAGCAPGIPDSNPRGVGFSNIDAEAARAREAELSGNAVLPVSSNRQIASETIGSVDGTPRPVFSEPLSAIAAPAAPVAVVPLDEGGDEQLVESGTTVVTATERGEAISDEQDFDAVASRESIESDAERRAQQQAAYQVIQPTAVPERVGAGRPNVVAFALSTNNRIGESLYQRRGLNREGRFNRSCAEFSSQDLAQEEFLAQGGPERDRRGMDPDGDGFACFWDPTPYRAARGATN